MSSSLFIQNDSFKNFTSHLSTDVYNMMIPAGKRQEQALAEKVRYPIKSADEKKKIMCNLSMLTADVFLFLFSLALNKSPSIFI